MEYQLDNYLIGCYTKMLRDWDGCSDPIGKENMLRQVGLMHLFLHRISVDHGFWAYVLHEIERWKETQQFVTSLIQKAVDEIHNVEGRLYKMSLDRKSPLVSEGENLDAKAVSEQTSPPRTEAPMRKSETLYKERMEYLQRRVDDARKRGDELEGYAVSSLLFQTGTRHSKRILLLGPHYPKTQVLSFTRWSHLIEKYLVRNIAYITLYSDVLPSMLTPNFKPLQTLLPSLFLGYSLMVRTQTQNSSISKLSDLIRREVNERIGRVGSPYSRSKFEQDLVIIACLIWFNGKAEREKEELLNKYYARHVQSLFDDPYLRGIVSLGCFQFEEAIESFKKSYEDDKTSANALRNIGISYFVWGKFSESKMYFQEAVSVNPNDILSSLCFGIVRLGEGVKTGVQEVGKVVSLWLKGGRGDDGCPLPFYLLVESLASKLPKIESIETIIDGIEETLPTLDEKAQYRNIVGRELTELGFVEEGERCLTEALELAETSSSTKIQAEILKSMGENFKVQGDAERALSCYERAKDRNPDDPTILSNIAVTNLLLLDGEEATIQFKKGKELAAPQAKPVFEIFERISGKCAEDALKLNYVEDDDARNAFQKGEARFEELLLEGKEIVESELTGVLVYYSYGLERLLDINFGARIRSSAIEKHRGTVLDKGGIRIPGEYWNGTHDIDPLPDYLKQMMKGKMNLGSWTKALADFDALSTNPIVNDFNDLLRTYAPEEIDVIGRACSVVAEYRNAYVHPPEGSSSTTSGTSSSVIREMRKTIILSLNPIINIFRNTQSNRRRSLG